MSAQEKYSHALQLYKTTDMSVTEISRECGVSRDGFSRYIQRAHRNLMFLRHGIEKTSVDKKMRTASGQTPRSRQKYRDAIEACDSEEYIELNVSQIAHWFKLDPAALSNQLKAHYPDVLERREAERRRLGIADNLHRGARQSAVNTYAEPLKLLETTDKTIEEVAAQCGVSFTGLRQHLLLYHKDLVARRHDKRIQGRNLPKIGKIDGNGSIRRARPEDYAKYARAVELYRTTTLTMKEICRITGNNLQSFSHHLRAWHKQLMFERRGATIPDCDSDRASLDGIKRFSPAVSEKYAPAVKLLAAGNKSVEEIAREFGFVPEAFRSYLRLHYHALWQERGMTLLPNGKKVLRRSSEKYTEAIELYRTTTESLNSIAKRLNITYNSLGGFLRRNMPEVIEEHNRLLNHSNP